MSKGNLALPGVVVSDKFALTEQWVESTVSALTPTETDVTDIHDQVFIEVPEQVPAPASLIRLKQPFLEPIPRTKQRKKSNASTLSKTKSSEGEKNRRKSKVSNEDGASIHSATESTRSKPTNNATLNAKLSSHGRPSHLGDTLNPGNRSNASKQRRKSSVVKPGLSKLSTNGPNPNQKLNSRRMSFASLDSTKSQRKHGSASSTESRNRPKIGINEPEKEVKVASLTVPQENIYGPATDTGLKLPSLDPSPANFSISGHPNLLANISLSNTPRPPMTNFEDYFDDFHEGTDENPDPESSPGKGGKQNDQLSREKNEDKVVGIENDSKAQPDNLKLPNAHRPAKVVISTSDHPGEMSHTQSLTDVGSQVNRKKNKLMRENAKDIEDENVFHIITPGRPENEMFEPPRPVSRRKTDLVAHKKHPTVRFYHRVCKKLGVLPLRKVVVQFGRSHLSFKNLTLTTKDMKGVCLALQKEAAVCSLDFTGNFMGRKELDYLLTVLNHLHTVFQVSLCNNCLSGQAVGDLSQFLLVNDFITRLDLSGNKLTDHDAQAITDILRNNKTLKTLLLNHNEFREEGGMKIGQALAENNTLEDIDLSWNHLRRCGAVGVAKGLTSNTALRNVNLAWNGFGFEGCVAVGDMLCCNSTITELDLAYNRINPPGLLEVLRGLAQNKTLRILRMGYNPVTAAFSSLILAVVKKHKESALENIDMAGVVVDKEFVALLEEIQKDRFFIVNYDVSLPVKKMSREEMREKIGLPSAYNVDPLRMLYLLKEKMRASDFFYKINKDHDDGLQRDELYSLFDEAGIPVTGSVVDKIFEFMDTNGDGTIDLGEFLQGDKRIKNISRKQMKDEQERRTKDASYSKYSRTFQKAHLDPITLALKVDHNAAPMRQSRRNSTTKVLPDSDDDMRLNIP